MWRGMGMGRTLREVLRACFFSDCFLITCKYSPQSCLSKQDQKWP